MKKKLCLSIEIIAGILIIVILLLIFLVYTHHKYSLNIPNINTVKAVKIQEAYTGPNLDKYTFNFDLSKKDQTNAVANILNWLNSSSNSLSRKTEPEPITNGGNPHTYLTIKFNDGKSFRIYVSVINSSTDKIVIERNDGEISLTEVCPQLVKFLKSDWTGLKGDVNKK